MTGIRSGDSTARALSPAPRDQSMIAKLPVVVRSTHIDMLGHVNNARFIEYLEWGRFAWLDQSALPESAFGGPHIATAVVRLEIDFKREAKHRDQLTVETSLIEVGGASFKFLQQVRKSDGVIVASAQVTMVVFDIKKRAAALMSDIARVHLNQLLVGSGQ